MRISLIFLYLTFGAFLNLSLASETDKLSYQCNYSVTEDDGDDTEYVVIDINLDGDPKVVYRTTELFEPLEFQVERVEYKSEFKKIYGSLPSPWDVNAKFEIKLYKGSPSGVLKVTVPGNNRLNPIEMTCT